MMRRRYLEDDTHHGGRLLKEEGMKDTAYVSRREDAILVFVAKQSWLEQKIKDLQFELDETTRVLFRLQRQKQTQKRKS